MARSTTDPRSAADASEFWEAARNARPTARRRRPHLLRWILLGLLSLLLLFIADLAWSGWTAYEGLRTAKVELQTGGDRLVAGNLGQADAAFQRAADAGDAASAAFLHPAVQLLSVLPGIGDDVSAGRALSDAAAMAGHGGLSLVDAAQVAGWDGEHIPGFGAGGRIDPGVIQRAAPAVAEASQLLTGAANRLGSIDVRSLYLPVADAVTQARDALAPRAHLAQRAALAAGLLPGFLGADGPRTYLLVMLQPSDPRGAGGYPGMYALVDVDGRRIRLQDLQPTGSIPLVDPVAAPLEVRRRYDARGSRIAFWDTTYSPDFPTDARLMLGIWEAAGHPPVDGVIAGDANLLSGVLEATGPVSTPEWPEPITPGNVAQVLGRDTYLTTSQPKSNRIQTAVGTALWRSVFTRSWSPQPMLSAIGKATGTRHLQIYSTSAEEQRLLSDLDVDGAVTFSDEQPPLVVFQGLSASRAGYFATFHTTTSERATADGTEVTVTVRMRNEAPDGPPSQLLGLPGDAPIGQFGVEMDLYLPPGAKVLESSVDGELGLQLVEREFGRPVVIQYLLADAGETSAAVIRYLIPT